MTFWAGFTEEFLQGAATTIAAAIVLTLATKAFSMVTQWASSAQDFNIRGIWVGNCILPSYGGEDSFEIWRYVRSGSNVRFVFFSYDDENGAPQKWIGHGVIRNHMLSAYYYQPTSLNYESGVVALQVRNLRLIGVYAQFDVKKDESDLYVGQKYEQFRAPLPFISKLRMILGLAPLPRRADVRALYAKASSGPPV